MNISTVEPLAHTRDFCSYCRTPVAFTSDWTLWPWPDGARLCATCNEARHEREDYDEVERRVRAGSVGVVDGDGELVELPPVVRDHTHEQRLRDADRQAKHAQAVQKRAEKLARRITGPMRKAMQNPEVWAAFLQLIGKG